MKLGNYFSIIAAIALVLPGFITCASAIHLPEADKAAVLLASAEEPHYASDILNVAANQSNGIEVENTHKHATELPFVCPMHPEVQSEKPGKCPKCGMKLQLREKTAAPAKETGHEHH